MYEKRPGYELAEMLLERQQEVLTDPKFKVQQDVAPTCSLLCSQPWLNILQGIQGEEVNRAPLLL